MTKVVAAWKRRRAYLANSPDAYTDRQDQYYSDREVLADWAVHFLSSQQESFRERMAAESFEPRDRDHQ